MSRVAGLGLAAGAGRRFGGPKAVAELAGERLVDRAVRVLVEGGTFPAYVVSGAVELDVPGAVVVPNPAWADGMGSSLRAGLAVLPPDVGAALVVLVDQPGLTGEAVARLVAAAGGPGSLAVATYEGRRGHPVLLGRAWWTEVADVAVGDEGAREVLRRHEDRLVRVECGDVASDNDVDRPEDLRRLTDR